MQVQGVKKCRRVEDGVKSDLALHCASVEAGVPLRPERTNRGSDAATRGRETSASEPALGVHPAAIAHDALFGLVLLREETVRVGALGAQKVAVPSFRGGGFSSNASRSRPSLPSPFEHCVATHLPRVRDLGSLGLIPCSLADGGIAGCVLRGGKGRQRRHLFAGYGVYVPAHEKQISRRPSHLPARVGVALLGTGWAWHL
jgi:hypothetical protein